MKICYLVLVYNNVDDSIETLEGIKSQDYPHDTVVIDNNSSPIYKEPIEQYCKNNNIKYIYRYINDGYAGGNNYGWNLLKDEYDAIFIVNNDIVFNDSELTKKVVNILESDRNISIVGPKVFFGNNQIVQLSPLHKFFYKFFFPHKLENHDIYTDIPSVIGCFLAIRTKCIERDCLFEQSFFMYCEEIELALYIWNTNHKVVQLIDKRASIYHKGGNNPYNNGAGWKFYLSMRNAILAARNFKNPIRFMWISVHFLSICKSFLFHSYKIRNCHLMFLGFTKGIHYLSKKISSYDIHEDAVRALSKY